MQEKILEMLQQVYIPDLFNEEDAFDYAERLKQVTGDLIWSWDAGASKFVLIFSNFDKVIKIPYLGKFNYDSCEEIDESLPEECYFDRFTGPGGYENIKREWDYCELETMFYKIAKAKGLEKYFAEEYFLGWVDDYPIYAQARVRTIETMKSNSLSDEEAATKKRCKELKVACLNSQWVTDFFKLYGEKEYLRLNAFLAEYNISDFHFGNLGYLNDKPILLDYSGFVG